tara:strand:+ start:57 stop:497 length:441 start_codon:yes stop_codon:yes gene_type:complete
MSKNNKAAQKQNTIVASIGAVIEPVLNAGIIVLADRARSFIKEVTAGSKYGKGAHSLWDKNSEGQNLIQHLRGLASLDGNDKTDQDIYGYLKKWTDRKLLFAHPTKGGYRYYCYEDRPSSNGRAADAGTSLKAMGLSEEWKGTVII